MMLPRAIPDLPGQMFLFPDLGEPTRRAPTQDEIQETLPNAAQTVMFKFHRGRPPVGMNWEDLKEEIICRGLKRLKNFQHGGKKTLREYAYKSCEFALRDIQRENLVLERQMKNEPDSLPLFDCEESTPVWSTQPRYFHYHNQKPASRFDEVSIQKTAAGELS